MKEVTGEMKNGLLNVELSGRVDSGNASDVEQEIIRIAEENSAESMRQIWSMSPVPDCVFS